GDGVPDPGDQGGADRGWYDHQRGPGHRGVPGGRRGGVRGPRPDRGAGPDLVGDRQGMTQPQDEGDDHSHESAGGRRGGLFHLLGRVELRFAQLCVVMMTVLVLTSAVARTVGTPMNWTVDLATFTFAWAVF